MQRFKGCIGELRVGIAVMGIIAKISCIVMGSVVYVSFYLLAVYSIAKHFEKSQWGDIGNINE